MNPLQTRPSREEDIPRMLEVFEQAKGIMRADGNMHQWTGGYPSMDLLQKDIARGVSYVIEEDGVIVGTFAFIKGEEPTYLYIEGGAWLDDETRYATIHRLASTKDSHGVAETCFNWCRSQIGNIRVDTHRDNRIMQHCILKAGFQYCGIIYLADGAERLAYQSTGQ